MKILHVNTIDTGGAAIAAIRLHYLLLESGIDSKILFLRRNGAQKIKEAYYFEDLFKAKWMFRLINFLNTIYNRRFTLHKPAVYFNGPDSLFDLTKHPLFGEADVIHLHWVVKFIDWKKVFSKTSKKFVWTMHDMNPFTGGEHYATGYDQEFATTAKRNIRKKISAIRNTTLTMVAPSTWMGGLAKNSDVFKNTPVITIKNPVDTRVFNCKDKSALRSKYQLPQDKRIILFVAENPDDLRKGYQNLVDAINRISDKEQYHLAIIGKKTVIPDSVSYTLMGTIQNEGVMSDLYNAADVFVMPSIEDNLPNTVSEALLCGTPVAGFRIGGVPDMVKNGVNGYLSDHFTDLDKAIVSACNHNFDPQEIRKDVLQALDPARLLSDFNSIYQE